MYGGILHTLHVTKPPDLAICIHAVIEKSPNSCRTTTSSFNVIGVNSVIAFLI